MLKYPVALIVSVVLSYGQTSSKASPDPHEGPVVQNAPEGKTVTSPKALATPKAAPRKTPVVVRTPAKKPKQVVVRRPLDQETAMIGTWNLVKTRSTYQPGPGPQSETRTYTKTPTGIVARVVTTQSDGTIETLDFPWMADGSEQSVKGSKLLDTIQLRQVDNLTAEASLRHGTKELVKERRELAADGKTMILTVTDTTSEERPVSVTAVYEKQ